MSLIAELYSKDSKVWIPDTELVWRCAILLDDYKGQQDLRVKFEDDQQESFVKVKSADQLPPLKNPDILIGENDLTALSYLHEPAVLHNLQVRFIDRNLIYTYCGIVLVAINPYESLPIYDNDTIRAYSGQDQGAMDPHIFAVAEEAFKRMSRFGENQSVIVSGESGAGKTVSAKYAMRYIATVCGAEAETQIEKKVLASNPIMEAFGNAKTTRNDNSSRFGKYIQIGFNKNHHIIGANMRTYLLEKSRVVFQTRDERNYHIFYQLCACAERKEFQALKLNHPDIFYYTNQGEAPMIEGVNDGDDLQDTRAAFTLLGVNDARQMQLFQILSGVLHLGNIVILEGDNDSCCVPKSDKHLPIMAAMFGIDVEQIRIWLCHRKVSSATETITTSLTCRQAYFAKDALAKHIYSMLFKKIVFDLNKCLSTNTKAEKFIGVLDIYGFETFEVNSFEQFCINFANEKLQQQFCLHVFKLEQEEYVKEEIAWSFIDFHDNQPCIDLIEGKLGLLDLLDEECKMPKGSEVNWCQKIFTKFSGNEFFEKPRMSNTAFIIIHFADRVQYQSDGFLEKNRDTVMEEQLNILKASQFEFVADLFSEAAEVGPKQSQQRGSIIRSAKEPPKQTQKSFKQTVGSQFRESLNMLMDTLFSTTPHYVRCIKPNDAKLAFSFDPIRAIQQLRACGVLETIRISAAGYPSRWTYADFFQRYRVLARTKEIQRNNMKKTCENILNKLIELKPSKDRDKYQFGKTKIFFRAGQVAYLEKLRSDRLRYCGVMIQKRVRGWLARIRYQRVQKMVRLVQKYGRGMLARRHAQFLRRTHAATIIQSVFRGHFHRQRFLKFRRLIVNIQAAARGLFGRQKFYSRRCEAKTVVLQSYLRGWLARKRYHLMIRGFTKLQGHVRRIAAKKELKQLKIEARSVEHIKKVAKGMENKIIELQQKLDEKSHEVTVLREDQVQLHNLRNEFEKLKGSEKESKKGLGRVAELEALVAQLTTELEQEKGEKERLTDEKNKLQVYKDQVIDKLTNDKTTLKEDLDKASEEIKVLKGKIEDVLKQQVEQAKAQFQRESEEERQHHQKLVKEYGRLQQRFENLVEENKLGLSAKGHQRSPSGISNLSLDSENSASTGEEKTEDLGYGSARRKETALEGQQVVKQDQGQGQLVEARPGDKVHLRDTDITLITRLQNRIKELERNKAYLEQELQRYAPEYAAEDPDPEHEIYETIKLQELEMENVKLRNDLLSLRRSVSETTEPESVVAKGSKAAKKLMDQFEAMTDELNRRREECIQLRTLLATRSKSGFTSAGDDSTSPDSSILNEDGELEMAYRTQKDLNKLLENELQRIQKSTHRIEIDLRKQLDDLRRDNDKQQKLIGQNLTLTPEARIEATMQHEISRLTSENLDLREHIDKKEEQIRKLKKALKVYAKRLKVSEASDVQAELEREMAADENMPSVKHHKDREFVGMLEYRREDESLLMKNLIIELKPRVASNQIPALPAFIIFMCIRHTDYLNDDEKVRSLLTSTINNIKKIVKKKADDVEFVTLWLSNTCRLLHNLKQYSGEKTFQLENSTKQNEHCLRNFDLSEYRQILSDLAIWIYQGLIKLVEAQVHPMIVGAVLENDAIAGLSQGKPSGFRGRLQSSDRGPTQDFSLDSLMKTFNSVLRVLNVHAVDPELIKQVFRQLCYFVCATGLNNLLLRKDLCHWAKGMQIRYNLSHLEQWMRENHLQETNVCEALEPIIQASQLLQARKTDSDVESICDMCSKLTTSQIIKILNLYTPVDEFEEKVPISFIRKIQERLSRRVVTSSTQTLLMDTKFLYAVTFPFNPSPLTLDTLVPPSEWGLSMLKRV